MNSSVDVWSLLEEARSALNGLLHRDQQNTCLHEDTHRGGSIWTICDACGAKWADDEGGKPDWTPPAQWTKAEAIISKLAKLRPSDVFAEETWAIRQDSDKPPATDRGPNFDDWLKEGNITTRGERLEQFMGFSDSHNRRSMMVSWLLAAWNAGIESGQPIPRDPDTGFRLDGKPFYPYDKR